MAKSRLQEWREENRRRQVRNIVIITLTSVLLILFLVHRWYVSIFDDHWAGRDQSVSQAVYAAGLVDVAWTELFNAEDAWFIVSGSDEEGAEKIVWVSASETVVRDATDGIGYDDARRIVLSSGEPIEIIRITPGVWLNELCYEVYYKVLDSDGPIYYYDYIRFADGEQLETLRLGK